jgi:multiple sugar transport system permease protein
MKMKPEQTLEVSSSLAPAEKVKIAPQYRKSFPWVLMAPTLVILVAIGIFPFLYSLRMASLDYILTKPNLPVSYVGLEMYREVIQNENFWNSLKLTLIFTIEGVFIQFCLGLGLAMLFTRQIKGKNIFRILILIPMILTPVVVAMMWKFLLYPNIGLVSYYCSIVFGWFGKGPPQFLATPMMALQTLIFIDIWEWTPFIFLILNAGLASQPREAIEAARIDGASNFYIWRTLTMPLLKPSIMIALIIRTMDAFRTFDTVAVLTQGGPGNATEILSVSLANIGFRFYYTSEATALSLIMLVIIVLMSYTFVRMLQRSGSAGAAAW